MNINAAKKEKGMPSGIRPKRLKPELAKLPLTYLRYGKEVSTHPRLRKGCAVNDYDYDPGGNVCARGLHPTGKGSNRTVMRNRDIGDGGQSGDGTIECGTSGGGNGHWEKPYIYFWMPGMRK
jgi:hypothetical protein